MSLTVSVTHLGVLDRTAEVEDRLFDAAEALGMAIAVRTIDRPAALVPQGERDDVVVLGPRDCTVAGLRRVARYVRAHPATVVAAVGLQLDRPSLGTLRAHGVRVVSRGPLTAARARTVLRRIDEELTRLRADTAGWSRGIVLPVQVADEPELDDVVDGEDRPDALSGARTATVVTVASATGGCGKTFYATNLAAVAASTGKRVLLVDLDLQFGEVAAALRVRHAYSVYDGLYDGQGHALPASELEAHLSELVATHELGFDVLTAPRDPVLADYVGARDAARTLDVVTRHYDVVIVDTPPALNEVVLTALDQSDVVAVLATLDVPSLKNLTVFLDTLKRLKLREDRVRLLLNKVESDIGISVGQAQDAFGGRFVGTIPTSRAVSRAINAGSVVVATEPRSAVSTQLRASVSAVLPAELAAPSPAVSVTRSWWARFFAVLRPSRAASPGGVR